MIPRYADLRGRTPHLLVVGDAMLDHYLWGKTERVSPEAPVVVLEVTRESDLLGGAGNVARNLLALGARVTLAATVGCDPAGDRLLALAAAEGLATAALARSPSRRTSCKSRLIAAHQQVIRYDAEDRHGLTPAEEAQLLATVEAALAAGVDAVVLSDYAKGVLTAPLTARLIAAARERALPVLVDPKGRDFGKYRGATLIKPNRKEAELATGMRIDSDAALAAVLARLRHDLDLRYALVTLSEEGLAYSGDGGEVQRIPALAREVFDVTGAGDTALAALAFALACGAAIDEAAHLANSAAAVAVERLGCAVVGWEEILAFETTRSGSVEEHILPRDRLAALLTGQRGRGRRIVFTNGCFDLLHAGHVRYLEAAKALGDLLVVGLNSDASVRRLKGPERPIQPEADRAYLLAALSCVDYVTLFDEETPAALIAELMPDLLVKGGDYNADELAGADVVRDRGGEVKILPYLAGRSTSAMVARIRAAGAAEGCA